MPCHQNKSFRRWSIAFLAGIVGLLTITSAAERKPNFVILLADDLGYADLGCYGARQIRTPRLDQLAREGMRFTDFYAQPLCGPSRAAIMTGCYAVRAAQKNNAKELHPALSSTEIILPQILRRAGYRSAALGKWDLAGHSQTNYSAELLPCNHGFDFFFGTPSSNDRHVNLLRGNELVEEQADLGLLSQRYTDEAIEFVRRHRDQPFLVYLCFTMPHTRLAASPRFFGWSPRGLYGDAVEELDWNTGRLIDTVRDLGLERDTYVIFTSDNGPWIHPGGAWGRAAGGNAEPLRGGKASTWEGGVRVPCIMWAPGRIPAGQSFQRVTSTMDLLPTLVALAGEFAPTDRIIDGHDLRGVLTHGDASANPRAQEYYYYFHRHLQAVRSGRWKLVLPRPANPTWLQPFGVYLDAKDVVEITAPALYDLSRDVGEQHDIAAKNPSEVARLLDLAGRIRGDLGDYDRVGKNVRSEPGAIPRGP
ncbi:MAG: N-acetylgalactosamine-6-sulfatase [Opitutus sp.]|nr:N-acetylgalactosamine-6-sulfatase [Opitutus sp.]